MPVASDATWGFDSMATHVFRQLELGVEFSLYDFSSDGFVEFVRCCTSYSGDGRRLLQTGRAHYWDVFPGFGLLLFLGRMFGNEIDARLRLAVLFQPRAEFMALRFIIITFFP